jgi:hypothetical protein
LFEWVTGYQTVQRLADTADLFTLYNIDTLQKAQRPGQRIADLMAST